MPLLSDALGEAARGFGVFRDSGGLPRADRSAFLVDDGVVTASWLLGGELPDVDRILAGI